MKYLIIVFLCNVCNLAFSQNITVFIKDLKLISEVNVSYKHRTGSFSELKFYSKSNNSLIFSFTLCKSQTSHQKIEKMIKVMRDYDCLINPRTNTFILEGYNFYPNCGAIINDKATNKIIDAFEEIKRKHHGISKPLL